MKFMGYKRSDGRVGVRNHVLVIPGVVCSAVAVRKICQAVPGAVPLHHLNGCGQTPGDTAITLDIVSGLVANGNVFGALIVGLGCETLLEDNYVRAVREKTNKPLHYLSLQKTPGGLGETVRQGVALVRTMMNEAALHIREECDINELILALECGGSDPTSGLSSNAVLGALSDRLIDSGGTAVLSETPEAIGAEHLLRKRGCTEHVGQKIYDVVRNNEKLFFDLGLDVRSGNPSRGNKASGITTLEEKSLGCIHKSGSRCFTECYGYGQLIDKKGLMFMDTTGHDLASITAKIAGGCQVVIFTTGMGTPVGSPVAPVIKITGNHSTYERLGDILDFDTSASLTGEKTITRLSEELWDCLIRVCEGEQVKAEINEAGDMAINQFTSYC